jgi:transcriptional regulator with XRE-family HTH domain
MNFADNIKRLRLSKGISQEQLARKLGVSRQAVSRWETGDSFPEMDKVLKMRALFDVPLDELMEKADLDVIKRDDDKQKKIAYDTAYRRFAASAAELVALIVLDVGWLLTEFYYMDTFGPDHAGSWGFFFWISLTLAVVLPVTIYRRILLSNTKKLLGEESLARLYSTEEVVKYNKTFAILLSTGLAMIFASCPLMLFFEQLFPMAYSELPEQFVLIGEPMMIMIAIGVGFVIYASLLRNRFRNKTAGQGQST